MSGFTKAEWAINYHVNVCNDNLYHEINDFMNTADLKSLGFFCAQT